MCRIHKPRWAPEVAGSSYSASYLVSLRLAAEQSNELEMRWRNPVTGEVQELKRCSCPTLFSAHVDTAVDASVLPEVALCYNTLNVNQALCFTVFAQLIV